MISVLMPSRGRPELVEQAVKSLGDGDFEVLVYLDLDDPELYRYNLKGCKVMTGARHGYGGLHEYYNMLSERALGNWLMLYNDDAIMETPDWTEIISKYDPSKPVVLNVWSQDSPDNLFPLISRKWYEVVGHFSRNTHADSWVQQIGERLGIQIKVPGIKITHQGENLQDKTHQEVKEIVRVTSAQYRNMEKERIDDAEKIRRWYEENNIKL